MDISRKLPTQRHGHNPPPVIGAPMGSGTLETGISHSQGSPHVLHIIFYSIPNLQVNTLLVPPCRTIVHSSPTSWPPSAPSQPINPPASRSATQPQLSPPPKSPRVPAPLPQKQPIQPKAPQRHHPHPPQPTTITTIPTTTTTTLTPTHPLPPLPRQLQQQLVQSKVQAQPLHTTTTTTNHPSPPHHHHPLQHLSRSTIALQTASVAGVTLPVARAGSAMLSVLRSGILVGGRRLVKSAFIGSGWLRRVGGGLAGVGGWGVLIS